MPPRPIPVEASSGNRDSPEAAASGELRVRASLRRLVPDSNRLPLMGPAYARRNHKAEAK